MNSTWVFETSVVVFLMNVVLLKGSVVVLVAGAVALLGSRWSAALRYVPWAASFWILGGLVCCFFFDRDDRPVPLQLAVVPAPDLGDGGDDTAHRVDPLPGNWPPIAPPPGSLVGVARLRALDQASVWYLGRTDHTTLFLTIWGIAAVWLSGMVVGLGKLLIYLGCVWSITRPVDRTRAHALWRSASASARYLGIRRPVRVVVLADSAIPCTWGAFRPIVAVPPAFLLWGPERRRSTLLHELAHVARWDHPMQVLAEVVRSVFWVNPLVGWAFRSLAKEREIACDDLVLQSGTPSVEYARDLLLLASEARSQRPMPVGSLGQVRASTLAERVVNILSTERSRRPATKAAHFLGFAFAVMTLVSLAQSRPIGLTGADQAAPVHQAQGAGQGMSPVR